MPGLGTVFRNPFSFLFTRSASEDRVSAYVIREHDRGRRLDEILTDPYIRNRLSEADRGRLLERPEIIHAIGESIVAQAREQQPSRS